MAKTRPPSRPAPGATALTLGLALLLGGPSFAAETLLVPEPDQAPSITLEQPTHPVSSQPGGPVLLSMSARLGPAAPNMVPSTIIPEFHFVAPNGDAVLLRRELVATSANAIHLNPSMAINVPPEAQKEGAVLSGGWTCHQGRYYATISAFILDLKGEQSNRIQYTVHCHGG